MDGPVEIELDPTPPPRRRRRFGAGRSSGRDERAADAGIDRTTSPTDGRSPLRPPLRPPSVVADDSWTGVGDSSTGDADDSPAGRRVLVLAAGAVLLLTGFLLGRSGGGSSPSDAAAAIDVDVSTSVSAPPTTRPAVDRSLVTLPAANPSRNGSPSNTERPPTTTTPPLRFADLGGPLTPAPTGLVVVGLTTEGELAEIDLDQGVARFVDVPDLAPHQATNSGYAFVGETSTVVGTWERQTASVVPVDGEPYQMPTSLSRAAQVVTAGAGPDLFWVQPIAEFPDYRFALTLADVTTGELVGETFELDGLQAGLSMPVGRLGPLINGVGGAYEIGDGGVRRITDGVIVGVGDAHMLAVECDEQAACTTVLIGDDGTRTATRAPTTSIHWRWSPSSISPDGATIAAEDFSRPSPGIAIIDLASGEEEQLTSRTSMESGRAGGLVVAWSADSRTLVFLDGRRLSYYDRDVGEIVEIGVDLPSLVTFGTRRTAPGTGTMVPPPIRQ